MSDANEQHSAHEGPHEGPIRTTKQLVWAVVASFVIPIIVIILLVNYVVLAPKPGAGSDGMSEEAIAQRLQPVGRVEVRDASKPAEPKSGQKVYEAQCAACHNSGAAGAPKLGDNAAWAARLATGYDTLLNSVLKGKGAMAAQAGGEHSDFELARAMVYVANQSGGKLKEPEAPAAAAASAPGSATK